MGRFNPGSGASRGSAREEGQPRGFIAALRDYPEMRHVPAHCLPEIVALRHGLRNAILLNFDGRATRAELDRSWRAFCADAGFHYHVVDTESSPKVLFTNTARLSVKPTSPASMGQAFGYPACCVAAHGRRKARHRDFPFVNAVETLAAPDEPVPAAMNFFLRETPFHLLKHLPCSYTCAASARLGEREGVYRAALAIVKLDRRVTDDERAFLARLRGALDLDEATIERIESQ